MLGPLAIVICLTITFGITQNILMYYAIQGENNGVRISCIVFLILAWIGFLVPTFLNLGKLRNIFKSDASLWIKFKSTTFFLLQRIVFVGRVAVYLGYFPSLVLFKQDRARFKQEFDDIKYYLIPATDFALFVLTLLHASIMY